MLHNYWMVNILLFPAQFKPGRRCAPANFSFPTYQEYNVEIAETSPETPRLAFIRIKVYINGEAFQQIISH